MKILILAATIVLSTATSFAGFLPITNCSNAHGDISIYLDLNRESVVNVTTQKLPETKVETFNLRDLQMTEVLLQDTPTQTRGTSETTVTFKEITLQKNDGSDMPNTYSKYKQNNGALVDYFVCSTNRVFYPPQC